MRRTCERCRDDDPHGDTLPLLKRYTTLFAPESELVGLRPDANQLAALARRYRLAYSVSPATATHPYAVTHSSAIYVFDRAGKARLLVQSLASTEQIWPGPHRIRTPPA